LGGVLQKSSKYKNFVETKKQKKSKKKNKKVTLPLTVPSLYLKRGG